MLTEISLKDAVEFVVDNRGKSVPVQDSGFPLIATNCISNENLYPEFNNVRYVSDDIYKHWFRSHPEPGDIILTNKGSKNGAICLVPEPVNFCIAQDMVALRAKKGVVYPKYLFAVLRSSMIQNRIKELNVDSVIPHFKKTDFNKLFFPLPKYEKQIVIGNSYFNLCNKIELNKQTNQTLEQMAQAIFKSWFVDFDPTRAKIAAIQNGEDPERAAMTVISGKLLDELEKLSPDTQQQLRSTAALFPDKLVDSELGEIPEGWEVKLNGDVIDVRDGTHDSPKQSETGFPLVTSKHITSGVLELKDAYLISEEDYKKVNKRSQVNQGDVLLTMIGTVGIPYLVLQPEVNFAIKNIGLFRTSENKKLVNYFYLLLKSPEMQTYLAARLVGTTQKYLSLKTLRSIEMIVPSAETLSAFNILLDPLMQKLFSSQSENNDLSLLRDSLLPKLLNGELFLDSTVGAL